MAQAALAPLITARHFDFDPAELVAGDPYTPVPLPAPLAQHFGRAAIERHQLEELAELSLWHLGPSVAAPLVDLLDDLDGDVDAEAWGDELELDEAQEDPELLVCVGGLEVNSHA
jgi:hypothetical protein